MAHTLKIKPAIIPIASGKGGVGKTFFTANLAIAPAESEMNETYSNQFVKSLKKISSIKKQVLNKIDKVLQDI
ncbi:MAG: hypothetical protein ACKVE4_12400 [Dissulfuribacterales bacterium]